MAAAGHDHVHVHFGARVFFVGEIEQGAVVHNSHARCRDSINQRRTLQHAGGNHAFERQCQRDECTSDRCRARSPIRLNHIAIEPHGALAERFLIRHGAQRSPDQPLNLLRAPGLLPACSFARGAFFRGARQHAVFTGDPSLSATLQESRNSIVNRRGADYTRVAEFDQHTAFRRGDKIRRDLQRPYLIRAASIYSQFSSRRCYEAFTRSTHGFAADLSLSGDAASLTLVVAGVNCCAVFDAGADPDMAARGPTGAFALTTNAWLKSKCPASVSTSWP